MKRKWQIVEAETGAGLYTLGSKEEAEELLRIIETNERLTGIFTPNAYDVRPQPIVDSRIFPAGVLFSLILGCGLWITGTFNS
ncbi:MAG: hypothetical protein GY750_18685 [Lentisphaerae bacterium]|nr:hypothetical protein [Lentisphaerota bacterium]